MSKRHWSQTGVPTAREVEEELDRALRSLVTESTNYIMSSLGVGKQSTIQVRVDLSTERVHIRFPCGDGNRWFDSEHGERYLQSELQKQILSHGFQGKGKPPRCTCSLRPVEITTTRTPLVQVIPGRHEEVMADIAAGR